MGQVPNAGALSHITCSENSLDVKLSTLSEVKIDRNSNYYKNYQQLLITINYIKRTLMIRANNGTTLIFPTKYKI